MDLEVKKQPRSEEQAHGQGQKEQHQASGFDEDFGQAVDQNDSPIRAGGTATTPKGPNPRAVAEVAMSRPAVAWPDRLDAAAAWTSPDSQTITPA